MKKLLLIICCAIVSFTTNAQEESIAIKDSTIYQIIKTDGSEFYGHILEQDARELLLLSIDGRQIYLPQHLVKTISPMRSDFDPTTDYVREERFSTRYFITTNGLPIKKGEHYMQTSFAGVDLQFGVGKNVGVGFMTSWLGMPVIGTVKKSFQLGKNVHGAVGGLFGTGTWLAPDWGGAIPFGVLSFGNRSANIAFSGGYGAVWTEGHRDGRALGSVAAMVKVSPKASLIFDSFILFGDGDNNGSSDNQEYVHHSNSGPFSPSSDSDNKTLALLIPGVRVHYGYRKAIQFGFVGVYSDDEFLQVPIPMIQWYRTL